MTLVFGITAACYIFITVMFMTMKPEKKRKMRLVYAFCSIGMLIVCAVASMMIK